jgi:hypothetical protein
LRRRSAIMAPGEITQAQDAAWPLRSATGLPLRSCE